MTSMLRPRKSKFQAFIDFMFRTTRSGNEPLPHLHPATLKFIGRHAPLEESYYEFFKSTIYRQSLSSFILGVIIYLAFIGLDYIHYPQHADTFLIIRLTIVIPSIILSIFFSVTRTFERYLQPMLITLVVIGGIGIILMIIIGGHEVNAIYYGGLILIFIYAYIFAGLEFFWALLSTWVLALAYEIVSIVTKLPWKIFVSNNYFFFSALFLGMVAGYAIEYYRRNMFFSYYLLKLEKDKIKSININLEKKVNERTIDLLKAKEEAEKADRMKSIFLAQMSHEIRTPLNAIMSSASILKYNIDENGDEDEKISLDIINKAGMRIIRTIDLLLNFSEIQSGTYKPDLTRFDLYSEVIAPLVAENKVASKNKNIKLSLQNNAKETEIFADHYTVVQIFTQLLDNAIKYTHEGEISIKIFYNETDKLTVEMKDTGIGIDKKYISQLFIPFSQEEMGYTRKYDGNGIGLALVKKYCDLNNAHIEVESKKKNGTIFRVIFSGRD